MTLDESKKGDVNFTDRGIKYVIDKELFNDVKPIKVDFKKSFRGAGFNLTSNLSKRPRAGDGCCG